MAGSRSPMTYVGFAIKDIRQRALARDRTMTQEHVAHEAGVSLRHYQKIEAGGIDVRLSTLFEISTVLRVTPQDVLDRADEISRGPKVTTARKKSR